MKKIGMAVLVLLAEALWGEEVVWYVNDFPPYTVLHGFREGEGIVQRLIAMLEKEVQGLKFSPSVANISRINENMKAGKPGVYGTMRRTPEREAYMYYSEPFLIYQSAGILVHNSGKDVWSRFLTGRSLDLEKALSSRDFRLTLVQDVALGSWVDTPAAKASPENLLILNLSAENQHDSRMQLLSMNRVTAAAGYEESLRMDILKAGLPLDNFVFLPVAGAPPYQKMSLSVPKTEWGQKFLDRINPVLIRLRPQVAREYETWISPESSQQYRLQRF